MASLTLESESISQTASQVEVSSVTDSEKENHRQSKGRVQVISTIDSSPQNSDLNCKGLQLDLKKVTQQKLYPIN